MITAHLQEYALVIRLTKHMHESKTSTATAQAPSNIAFVKYWGKSNHHLTLPQNASISMSLDALHTTTTVTFSPSLPTDEVWIEAPGETSQQVSGSKARRVIEHLDRLRQLCGDKRHAKVTSVNNFPSGVGIASSASAFAALTLAATTALGISCSPTELSRLTRLGGSGSATRSIFGGYVEWLTGDDQTSVATQLAPETHWALTDIVAILSTTEKKVSSLEGHELASTSPFYQTRLADLPRRLRVVKAAIQQKDLTLLGTELEPEALSLHTVAMTCVPPVFYPMTETFWLLDELRKWRDEGIEVYGTMDAGPNVHCICNKSDALKIASKISALPYVHETLVAQVGGGANVL